MRTSLLLSLLLLIIPVYVFSQSKKLKNVTKQEMALEACDFYPDVTALILRHTGNTWFEISDAGVPICYQSELFRIKIIEDAGKEYATVKVRLYSPEDDIAQIADQISNLNAYTYNMENDQIVKTKMEKSAIYETRLNKFWKEVSFVLPNVQKGSVIEYSYTKNSGRISDMDEWYFQKEIPTLYCELWVSVPEFLIFKPSMQGSLYPVKTSKGNQHDPKGYVNNTATYIAEKIPPVEEEPFIANPGDLPFRLKFQLIAIDLPNIPYQSIAETYESFNKKLMENDNLGNQLSKGGFASDIQFNDTLSAQAKADTIFSWIKQHISWNRFYGITTSQTFRKSLNEGKGNVADINLALVAAMRAKGLDAFPVILSTRGHGNIHPVYPNFKDFNYLIAALVIDKKNVVYYDATEDLPAGLIPARCLNGSGWLIGPNEGQLVPLRNKGANKSSTSISMEIKSDTLRVDIVSKDYQYAAVNKNTELSEVGKNKLEEETMSDFKEWELQNFDIESGKDMVETSIQLKRDIINSPIIYIQPFIYGLPTSSPFKRDKRQAVIDFPYPIQDIVVFKLIIPEGYTAEYPKSIFLKLGQQDAIFNMVSCQSNNILSLTTQFRLFKQTYSSQEYPQVKSFFDQIAETAKSVITLKKTDH